MKAFYFLLFSLLMFTACEKNGDFLSKQDSSISSRAPKAKVDVCHYDADAGTWHVININANALPAHLAHGDVLLVDSDEDGWVAAENECVPGGDCDDDDASVNPGASEVCDNGTDDDCDGYADCDDSDCSGSGSCDLCGNGGEACCFCPAVTELNLTCWNGDVNDPILWDANAAYGLCSNCLGGNCGYNTPTLGYVNSGAPAGDLCREYLVALAAELGLGIGPTCSPMAPGAPVGAPSGAVFGQ